MNETDLLKKAITPKSDQLNADDLLSGSITITVREVKIIDSREQPITIFYDGDNGRPFKPCKSMAKVLSHISAWGMNPRDWIGRSMTLFNDSSVTWAGVSVGGIRISHLSHIENNLAISIALSKGKKQQTVIKKLMAEQKPQIELKPLEHVLEEIQLTNNIEDLTFLWQQNQHIKNEIKTALQIRKSILMAQQSDQSNEV